MFVSEINLDSVNWESEDLELRKGSFKGSSVYTLGQDAAIKDLSFGINETTGTLEKRKIEIGPLNSIVKEVEVGVARTNSDGSSNEFKVRFELRDEKDKDEEAANSDNGTKASDIDSRDRDFDKDNTRD